MILKSTAAITAVAACLAVSAPALASDNGKLILNNRLRAETVDQDGLPREAEALTTRLQLGWQSPQWGALRFQIAGETTYALNESYNSTLNGKTAYPVVADPETSELSRINVTYTGLPKTEITVGRQTIVLDNARFVGDVGFRQTEQTFDGAKAVTTAIPGVTVTYAWAGQVNRIFGHKSPQGQWEGDIHILNAVMKTPLGALSLYDYALDFDNVAAASTLTYGVRLTGGGKASEKLAWTYSAEWAQQGDNGGNPASFAVDYTAVSTGLTHGPLSASFSFERLGSDNGVAFQTPLATLHAFQGWADVFLTTPAKGIDDMYAGVGWTLVHGRLKSVKLTAVYHDFRAARSGVRYGDEWDAGATVIFDKHLSAGVKVAVFDGHQPAMADRTKFWMSLDYSY
jgi:hypothetical protein